MEVLLLTRDACTFCDRAKEVLGRLSSDYAISVRIVDMDSPEGEDLVERGGVMFPPGILLDGEPFSFGRPSERKLRRELEQRLVGDAR